MSIREFDFQKQRVRVRTTSCANAHVACDFGHYAVLFDVKANFAKSGTPIQSQNSHGSSLIVVLEKSSAGQQHADSPHPLRLLRARRERPPCCAAEQRDELAAFHARAHSITSSARSRNDSGILRPSALAVVRLTMRSYLVGCSTGRSSGLVPRRILLT